MTSPATVWASNGIGSISSLPASIFEKSRMSLMIVSSASPEWRTVSAYSRCSGVSGVSSSSPVMPITPFIGVRISWLIVARNSLLARLAASAASRACRSSSSARLCAVMSLYVDTKPPPRMGLSWTSMMRPLDSARSTRRGWNVRASATRSAICAAGSPGPYSPRSATTRQNSSKGRPIHAKSGVTPHDVERAAVPRGQAQLAVEGQQALPHALQRGLEQRRLVRDLGLAPPRRVEQLRVLQRDGRLAGERGHQPDVRVRVRVRLRVAGHEHAVDAVAENDGRGDEGARRRALDHRGRVVRRNT